MNTEHWTLLVKKIWWWVSRYTQKNNVTTVQNVKERWFAAQIYSAIRDSDFNATDNLIDLAESLNRGDKFTAITWLEYIQWQTKRILWEHYTNFADDIWLQQVINQQFEDLEYYINLYDNDELLDDSNDYWGSYSIMGFWENLTAKIYEYLLRKEWLDVVYLWTEWMKVGSEKIQNMWELLSLMKIRLKEVLWDEWVEWKVIMSPGFIGNLLWWINGMIGRWFTDAVTGLVALCLLDTNQFEKVVFEVHKDVAGILSTNPNDLSESERVKLLEEVSIELAIRLFGEHGANSWLLNKSTINTYVIDALKNDPRFTVEIKNPDDTEGRKTIIKNNVEKKEAKVDIIASREEIAREHRNLLWFGSQTSLYILWENLWITSTNLLDRASSVLLHYGISGVNFSLHFGLKDTLVVSFNNDAKTKQWEVVTAKEKSKKALNFLHHYLIEEPMGKIGTYKSQQQVADVA
jgi:aspartokinase